jgi:hypothetical protein
LERLRFEIRELIWTRTLFSLLRPADHGLFLALKRPKLSPFWVMCVLKIQLNAELTEGLNGLLHGLTGNATMKKILLISVAVVVSQITSLQMATAAKYFLCVTCSAGGPYLVGSPTPNPGGSYQTALCANNGAGTPVSMSLAPVIGGRHVCAERAVKIDDIIKVE